MTQEQKLSSQLRELEEQLTNVKRKIRTLQETERKLGELINDLALDIVTIQEEPKKTLPKSSLKSYRVQSSQKTPVSD